MKPRIAITLEMSAKGERRLNFLDLAYAQCVAAAGGVPVHFPSLPAKEMIYDAVSRIEALVLTGGADIHPSYYGEEISAAISLSPDQRTDFDLAILQAAMSAGKAILAICHGMQIVNLALGGTLYQDIPTQVPGSPIKHREAEGKAYARHSVRVEPGSRLATIFDGMPEFKVTSTHHQAIKSLGKGMRVSAQSPDGLIEGIELAGYPKILGVQWHPEKDPASEASKRIFKGFVALACS
ncbi:MAG: gamma-glutamyl-gamma-aminobutyrate hydrolase family protein [Pseudomonadota bacterium]